MDEFDYKRVMRGKQGCLIRTGVYQCGYLGKSGRFIYGGEAEAGDGGSSGGETNDLQIGPAFQYAIDDAARNVSPAAKVSTTFIEYG